MTYQQFGIQAIGLVGVVLFVASYQMKLNKILFALQVLGGLTFGVQFLIMGALSGSFSLFALLARNLLMMQYSRWKFVRHKIWIGIFIAIYLVIMVTTWKGWISILPFAAMIVSTIGSWTNTPKHIRLSNLACASPCWLIYDCLVGSIGGVINESITLVSIVISIWRFGWKNLDGISEEKSNT